MDHGRPFRVHIRVLAGSSGLRNQYAHIELMTETLVQPCDERGFSSLALTDQADCEWFHAM